jgi:hypothetical protein
MPAGPVIRPGVSTPRGAAQDPPSRSRRSRTGVAARPSASGGLALGDPSQDQDDLGGSAVGLVGGGAGEGVEYPAAAVTAVVQGRGAVPPVDPQAVAGPTARADQAVGVEDGDEPLVAGVLVHGLGDGGRP